MVKAVSLRILTGLLFTCLIVASPINAAPSQNRFEQLHQTLQNNPKKALLDIAQALEKKVVSESSLTPESFSLSLLKIQALTKLGQYDKAYQHIAELTPQIEGLSLPDAQAQLSFMQASLLLNQNKTAEAKKYLEQALLSEIADPLIEADIHDGLSQVYRAQANYIEAKEYSEKAIAIAEQFQDKRRIANFYNKLGIILDYMGLIESALSAHEVSLNTQRQLNNQQGISNSLYNIAELFRDLENFSQSLAYFRQALQVDLSLGDPRHIANSYGKIGQVLSQQGLYTEAIAHIEKGLLLTREMQADSDTAWQLSNLININLAQNNNNLALSHAKEALALAISSNAKRTERMVRLSLANTYIAMGEFEQAKTQLHTILAESQVGIQMQSDAHKKLSEIAQKAQKFDAAFEHLQHYQELQSSLRKVSDQRKELQMKINVELAKKEQALMLLQKAQSLQQVKLDNLELQRGLAASLALLVLAVMAIYYLRQRQKEKYKALEQRLAQESLTQKNKLLADISHDLRTPLTSLSLIVEALIFKVDPDPDAAYKKIECKIGELDNLITDIYQSAKFNNNTMTLQIQAVNLSELVGGVCDELSPLFVKKSQILHFDAGKKDLQINADPSRLNQVILNLLRNSHFYTDIGGQCHVSVNQHNEQAVIIIEDSSPGVSSEEVSFIFERSYRCESANAQDDSGSGLGLAICKEVIEAHNGGIQASNSELGGLLVILTLPLNR